MDEYKHASAKRDKPPEYGKSIEYRIVARQFERAFEACGRLPHEDQDLLLKEVAASLLQQLRPDALEEECAVKVVGIEIKQL